MLLLPNVDKCFLMKLGQIGLPKVYFEWHSIVLFLVGGHIFNF